MLSAAVRRLSPLQWAGVGLGGCAVLLALLGLLAPASAFFFPLLSLWASVGLFVLALCVLRVAGAELDFFHKAVVFGIWAVAVVYFYWTLSSRSFVYVWDYANYLLKQYDAEAAFAQSAGAGLAYIFGSMADDYTNFITLFTEFPFCLTSHTGDAYSFSQVFCILPTLLVLLAVVWSGYALWDNSRVYAAADNVQAGLLAFKPQPQEDNSLSFGQLRDINPDVCGWLTLDGTAIDYPVVQGESNFTYLNTDVYGSFALAGSIFLDVDCDADFSGRYSLLYGHHMENGRMFGDLDKYKDGAFFRQNTTGTLTLPGGSYRLEVLACLVVPASEQAIFAPGKWRSDAGGLLPFVEENALQMDAQALRALEEEPEGAQFLAMATCSGEYTDARTVVLARMEPMSDLQNGKEESLS